MWDEKDGFYYDHVRNNQNSWPLKIKPVVGLVPLFCTLVLKDITVNYEGFILFSGLWDEKDGFYYDHVRNNQNSWPLKIKPVVGLVPLFCTLVLKDITINYEGFILFSGLWDEKDGFYYDHV